LISTAMSQPPPFPENRHPTEDEFDAQLAFINRKKPRQKRPGQLPPFKRRGKRQGSCASADVEDVDGDYEYSADADTDQCTAWGARMQQQDSNWEASREANQHMAQQYAGCLGKDIHGLQVDAALHQATQAMGAAAATHTCCALMEEDHVGVMAQQLAAQLLQAAQDSTVETQQQQQEQQQQYLAQVSVTKLRAVACHSMAASFWLPVPTLKCSCCNDEWELQAAAAGFFGNSPLLPSVWFSTQLLDVYSTLFRSGLSASRWCEAISVNTATREQRACMELPRIGSRPLLPIDDRWVRRTAKRLLA
jgi:hypothetical protein